MFDETSRSHTDDDSTRHIHRGHRPPEEKTVEVDSAAFFAPETAAPTPPPAPPKPPKHTGGPAPESKPPRRKPDADTGAANPKRGTVLLIVQAILSIAAFLQLCRTQMLPALYLVIIAALLVLFWLLVKRCQEYSAPRKVSRVFSVFLCAFLALGCVWAQQGLSALDNVTSGLVTGTEANKITKEPFVVYLSGVDNRGELTEKARSDVNILAVVNPSTKRVALINTPRDYYVDLAGTSSKDKLTHAGLYGVETSMATLGNLYGVNVDQYLRINFAGFISIIDAVGGVDVYSDQAFTSVGSPGYYDPTTFAEGWNHLDGKSALAFARERHAFASGDIQRGINQMKVIDAMMNKIKSPTVLMSFSKLMDAVSDCFVTSLSQEQISALVRMQLSDFAEWNIESYTVTGSSGSSTKCYSAKGQKLYVMKPDENSVAKAKEMIAAVLGGIGWYLYGMFLNSLKLGKESVFNTTGEVIESIWVFNPFKNLFAVFTPFGLGVSAFIALMVCLITKKGYSWFSGYKFTRDARGFDILPDGTHGTSGFATKKELAEHLELGSAEEVTGMLLGRIKARPDDPEKYATYVAHRMKPGENNNILCIGAPGSYKSRGFIIPFLMGCTQRSSGGHHESVVVTDPKGSVVVECGPQRRTL